MNVGERWLVLDMDEHARGTRGECQRTMVGASIADKDHAHAGEFFAARQAMNEPFTGPSRERRRRCRGVDANVASTGFIEKRQAPLGGTAIADERELQPAHIENERQHDLLSPSRLCQPTGCTVDRGNLAAVVCQIYVLYIHS